jgi:PAS domain S-box-containing protein
MSKMTDRDKTKEQLIGELMELRQQLAEVKAAKVKPRLATENGLRIGEILVEMGYLTETQLKKALLKQKEAENEAPLGRILIHSGIISAEQLYIALVEQLAQVKELQAEGKRTREELKETQKYAQDIVSSSLDMIIAVDNDRRIVEFNETAQKTFGYSREEILGKHVGILYSDRQEGIRVGESTRRKGWFIGEIANKRKNGEIFPSLLSASVLRDTKGEPIGFMGISRDITEQKCIEERLRRSEKMASLGRLVAGACHELNNPISFIYSNISHLRTYMSDIKMVLGEYSDICSSPVSSLPDHISSVERLKEQLDLDYTIQDLDELVDEIDEGARRIKGIVEDLRIFSHSDGTAVGDTDINEDIEKSLSLLADYHVDRIAIHRDYAELPRVRCYEGQLSQVFMNVIVNACQAIEHNGDIWITTGLENDNTIAVSIRDNGAGIAKEHMDRIFDPFFTTKDVGQGMGLGMSISYGIIERHGGEILVESESGSGTVFTIQIPVDFQAWESRSGMPQKSVIRRSEMREKGGQTPRARARESIENARPTEVYNPLGG